MSDLLQNELLRGCRVRLEELQISIQARADQWEMLPGRIESAISFARAVSTHDSHRVVTLLLPFQNDVRLDTLAGVRDFAHIVEPLIDWARDLPGSNKTGSLFQSLHGSIEQVLYGARAGVDDLQDNCTAVIQELQQLSLKSVKELKECLSVAIANSLNGSLRLAEMREAVAHLKAIFDILPIPRPVRRSEKARTVRTSHFSIAVIEDEPHWQEFACEAVRLVQCELGDGFTLDCHIFDNAADARANILNSCRHSRSDKNGEVYVQTIAIVDMGLPTDSTHVHEITQHRSTPDRNVGQGLLAELRSYTVNIPCIVLTIAPRLMEDQKLACSRGVREAHYVLKSAEPNCLRFLVEALLDICASSQQHQVEAQQFPSVQVVIDSVLVPLTDKPAQTFYSLCRLSRYSNGLFTKAAILRQLQRDFDGDFNYGAPPSTQWEAAQTLGATRGRSCWTAAQQKVAATVIDVWADCKSEDNSSTDLHRAVIRMAKDYRDIYLHALSLATAYLKRHPAEAEVLSAYRSLDTIARAAAVIESVFGGLYSTGGKDYNLHNIHDHVVGIRQAIHSAFQKSHKFVRPELLLVSMPNEADGYRVNGNIVMEEDAEERRDSEDPPRFLSAESLRVLVVENERILLDRICKLLTDVGFDVVAATNTEDAIEAALSTLPDILLLDMHIPATRTDWEQNPEEGNPDGGLNALEQIRVFLPDVAVICPTTLTHKDHMRKRAETLNVPITAFVPKGGPGWEGELLININRLAQKLRTGRLLPPSLISSLPIVRILPSSNLETGQLMLEVNAAPTSFKASMQGRLLALLLQSSQRTIPWDELDMQLLGKSSTTDQRKGWLKNIRKKMRNEWPGVIRSDGKPLDEEVLKTLDDGLVLNVYVEPRA